MTDECDDLTPGGVLETLSSPDRMRDLIERVKAHLGTRWERLKHPHRLHVAVAQLERGIERFERTERFNVRSAPALVELHHFDMLAAYWSRDPEWHRIVKWIGQPHRYAHDAVMLSFAERWRKQAAVNVQLNEADRLPSPDLYVTVEGRDERLGVEVKVPQALCGPRSVFRPSQADEVISRCLDDARDQLLRLDSGSLIVGAFHLTQPQLLTGAEALRRSISRHGHEYPHLAGIWIVSVAQSAHHAGRLSPRGDFPPYAVLRSSLQWAVVENPGYTGGFQLRTSMSAERPTS